MRHTSKDTQATHTQNPKFLPTGFAPNKLEGCCCCCCDCARVEENSDEVGADVAGVDEALPKSADENGELVCVVATPPPKIEPPVFGLFKLPKRLEAGEAAVPANVVPPPKMLLGGFIVVAGDAPKPLKSPIPLNNEVFLPL